MTKVECGDVWLYDYLWSKQYDADETEGSNPPPAALVENFKDQNGNTNLIILAITTTPPTAARIALEIPPLARRRARLDDDKTIQCMQFETHSC